MTRWSWQGCPLAEGLYDYAELVRYLPQMGYTGFISVEDLRSEIDADQRLQSALAFLIRE